MPPPAEPRAEVTDTAALFEAHFPLVYAYFRRRVADDATAEDLTAETFAHIVQALPAFRPEGEARRATRVWVYRIAGNVYKNALRARDRRLTRDDAWARGWRPVTGDRAEVERGLALGQAVAHLDPSDRDILGLRFWEGLSAPEIAAVTGLAPREVYTAIERAVRRLRRDLDPFADVEEAHGAEA